VAIPQRDFIGYGIGIFIGGKRFSSQRCFVYAKTANFDQSNIGGRHIAGLKGHDIARRQLGG
jgi:hypothetical protein